MAMEAQATPAVLIPRDARLGKHERSVDGCSTVTFTGEDERTPTSIYLERYVMGTIFGHFYRGIQHGLPQGRQPQPHERLEQNRRAVKCIYIDKYSSRATNPSIVEDPDNELNIKAHIEKQSTFEIAFNHHVILPQRVLSNQMQTDLVNRAERYFVILSPFANGGDLFEQMTGGNFDSNNDLLKVYFRQIIQGVQYLHNLHVFHADLKPENMVTHNGEDAFVIDFGQAVVVPAGADHIENEGHGYGTKLYTAPEFNISRRIDWRKADVWALGVSFFIMILKVYPPWAIQDRNGQVKVVNRHNRYFQSICRHGSLAQWLHRLDIAISDEAVDLLQRMLFENIEERISIDEILTHPWIQS